MAPRRSAAAAADGQAHGKGNGKGGDDLALQRKLTDLVARQQYAQAIRAREQALRRQPDLKLTPGEAQLWCLEGGQALEHQQPKRAEIALTKAIALGLHGEPLLLLARLRLNQERPEQALTLLEQAFAAGQLAPEYAGAYLKLLLLQGQEQRVRSLLREQPDRFLAQQLHWASGVLSLLEGNPVHARRQFDQMAAPATPGDHGAVWRAWALLEAGDHPAAANALKDADHPACAALALDLAARSGELPTSLLAERRRHPPRQELVRALELLYHLRQQNLLQAGQLLLAHERQLLAIAPGLAPLRRPLLLLAGQQALERDAPLEAIRCWRPIVDRPVFDPDLALRLFPLLEQGDAEEVQEAERLAGQLLGWVRRAARDTPAAWPEPLLSTTLARLHCWQADQLMRLGGRQQARRSVEQARQLAPELPDVTGRRGMLAAMNGASSIAIPLLWQALEGGCRSSSVYEVLDETLTCSGLDAERRRLQQQYGSIFGVMVEPGPEQGDMAPAWLEALSHGDVLGLGNALNMNPDSGAGLEALRIFIDQIAPPRGATAGGEVIINLRKVTLELPEASRRWDALLTALPPLEQVEALTAIVAALQRFCRRSGKPLAQEITVRLLQLEQHAAGTDPAQVDRALRSLLLLLGLRLKRGESPAQEASRLLRASHQPERLLPLALLDLRLLCSTKPWLALVQELRRQDPQNPLLTLALATMERSFTRPYDRLSEQAFDQARRQQDSQALAACRREQAWIEESFDREQPRRQVRSMDNDPTWQTMFTKLDFQAMFRQMAAQNGVTDLSDAQLEKMLPEFEHQARVAFAPMDPEEFDLSGFLDTAAEPSPPPPPPRRSQRRTFMDL
ncbi:MAG: hypothetical protein WAM11_12765 [Cyanobium sp.]